MTLIEVPVLLQFRAFWFGVARHSKQANLHSATMKNSIEFPQKFKKKKKKKKKNDLSIPLLGIYLKKIKTLT